MKIEYDRQADALYITFRPVSPGGNLDIEEGVTVDLDSDGHIVGLEVIDASHKFGLEALVNVTIENMPVEQIPG